MCLAAEIYVWVQLPASSAIAARQQAKVAAEAAERAEMKRLVLQASPHVSGAVLTNLQTL